MKTTNKATGAEADETVAATAPSAEQVSDNKVKPAKKAAKKAAAKPAAKKVAAKKEPAKKAARKTTTPKKTVPKAATKKVAVKKASKKTADVRTADNSNRDFGKFNYGGEALSKTKVVLAVVTKEASKKGMTPAKLQEKFPDELMPAYGVVRDLTHAKRVSTKKMRYLIRPEQIITLGNKKVAVCNQWSSERFESFRKHAKTLGYNINPARK